jgi:hypothetical protein
MLSFFNDVDTFTAIDLFLLSPLPIDAKRSAEQTPESGITAKFVVSSCNAIRNNIENAPMPSSLRPQSVDWTFVERNAKNYSRY